MRSADQIKKLIIDLAVTDERIRAVLLNGSRANDKIQPDQYQDFDIVYIVNDLDSFITDHSWTNVYGEKLIWQLPDEMTLGNNNPGKETASFTYLMLFTDGNRIDLTLFPKQNIKTGFKTDSLGKVWLDKDNLFHGIPVSTDYDYLVTSPTEKEFLETCNEFWWVSIYVAKGLLRNEITYAKENLELYVRPMFMKIIAWEIGTRTGFSVSVGKSGKFIHQYLPRPLYNKILYTYSDSNIENNWNSLFEMTRLFSDFTKDIAGKLGFAYNLPEERNVMQYLQDLHEEQKHSE